MADSNVVNVLGERNQDSKSPPEFTFHHGHVDQIVNSQTDLKQFGYLAKNIPTDLSQVILVTPTFASTLGSSSLKKPLLMQPLLRGFSDSVTKGDCVIYFEIGTTRYYLGPLNTTNNPNYTPDPYFNPNLNEINLEADTRDLDSNGYSTNFIQIGINKISKLKKWWLDRPYNLAAGNIGSDADLSSYHSDLQLEGRHGNSIQIGSRFINPYITIRNNDIIGNNGSFIGMLSLGSINDYVNGFNGLSSDINVEEARANNEQYPGHKIGVGNDPTNVEDIPRQDIFNINYGNVKQTSNQQTEFDQLIMFSDRITFDAQDNDLTMSAKRNINVGAGQNISITSKGFSLIESNNIYLGVQSQAKTEPMVLGEELRKMLEDITKILKNAHALVQGVPVPLTDALGAPLNQSKSVTLESPILNLTEIVKQLEARTETDNNGVVNYGKDGPNFLSHHHYIETNRQEPTQE